MLTTHRILWFKDKDGLEIPLFYVKDFKKGVIKELFYCYYLGWVLSIIKYYNKFMEPG